ncbi:hypothetical protein ACFLSV_02075 [Bacteroidota bacterium]
MNMFIINQTGFAPVISSYTNFGEGVGIFGDNTSNDSFLMDYLERNLLIIERDYIQEEDIEPILNQEHENIKNAIVGRKNPAILKHL